MNIALIGLGNIASTHINSILPTENKIVALCDIDIEKAHKLNEKYNLKAQIYSDYKEMLNSAFVDCVHILTPHNLHKEMIIFALNKNINVLCEKPVCMNTKELLEVEQVLFKNNAKLGVCHQNRYTNSNLTFFNLIKGQDIKGGFANVVWCRDKNYYNSADWRGKLATEGGGVLINQALHTLDLIIKVAGMPNSLIAHCQNDSLQGVIEVEDTANILLKYPDKTINFYATVSCTTDLPVHITIRTNEHIYIVNQNSITIDGEVNKINFEKNNVKDYWGDGHKKLISKFYSCLKNNELFELDLYESSKVIKLIEAAYSSNGKEILLHKEGK